jgi:hypothetical protein
MIKVFSELYIRERWACTFVGIQLTKSPMKSKHWLALHRATIVRALVICFAVIISACSEDAVLSSAADGSASGGGGKAKSGNNNSQSNYGDYNISVSKDGKTWTYVITKNAGAKGLSHFILDLQNCPGRQTLDFSSIVSATVNGQPATLATSEGKTGCDVASVTSNFVKFDDLQDADSYTIVFVLNQEYGNFLTTTAWLKAGTSCHAYTVNGPCCAF